jgi:hypothetical protein
VVFLLFYLPQATPKTNAYLVVGQATLMLLGCVPEDSIVALFIEQGRYAGFLVLTP